MYSILDKINLLCFISKSLTFHIFMAVLSIFLNISFFGHVNLRGYISQFELYNLLMTCNSDLHRSTKAWSKKGHAMRLAKDTLSVLVKNVVL